MVRGAMDDSVLYGFHVTSFLAIDRRRRSWNEEEAGGAAGEA